MPAFGRTAKVLRRALVQAGSGALYHSGALNLLHRRSASGDEVICPFAILLFHRVNADEDPFFPAISVKTFDAQMSYLARNFRVRPLKHIVHRLQQRKQIEPWTIAVTFDDGYRDNYVYAHPILQKYGLPATLFAATGYIGTGRVLWNDRLAAAVKHTKKNRVRLSQADKQVDLPLGSIAERLNSLELMLESLKTQDEATKSALLEQLVNDLRSDEGDPQTRMLDWDEVRALAHEGWDVGSHTVNHVILTKVPDSGAYEELTLSKCHLETELQQSVKLFAYPNGKESDFNAMTGKLVENSGYAAGFTTISGFNDVDVDSFEIHRLSPWEERLPNFAVKLQWSFWAAMKTKNARRSVVTPVNG